MSAVPRAADGHRPSHVEGYNNAEWILLDYGDLVIHIFSRRARAYYDLERLWRDAKLLDVGRVLTRAEAKTAPVTRGRKRNS